MYSFYFLLVEYKLWKPPPKHSPSLSAREENDTIKDSFQEFFPGFPKASSAHAENHVQVFQFLESCRNQSSIWCHKHMVISTVKNGLSWNLKIYLQKKKKKKTKNQPDLTICIHSRFLAIYGLRRHGTIYTIHGAKETSHWMPGFCSYPGHRNTMKWLRQTIH